MGLIGREHLLAALALDVCLRLREGGQQNKSKLGRQSSCPFSFARRRLSHITDGSSRKTAAESEKKSRRELLVHGWRNIVIACLSCPDSRSHWALAISSILSIMCLFPCAM
jgi:hypothetical protein